MKKVLAVVLAAAMVMSMTTAAFADDQVIDTNGSLVVSYGVDETFKVTIPADIALSADNLQGTGTVTATNVRLTDGTTMKVSVYSVNNYNLVNGESKIAYALKSGDKTYTNDDNVVLSVAAGSIAVTDSASTQLTFATSAEAVEAATLAGAHQDTLSFSISFAREPGAEQ